MGQAVKSSDHAEDPPSHLSNGLESEIDLMTLVQLPATRLKQTVRFYVEVLELTLSYPERPIESNTFVQTLPRKGPSLHILETPDSEFRPLHGTVNGNLEEYLAFYAKSLVHLHERLLQAGAEIVIEPSDGYMSFFDPEGHLIGAYERTDSGINDRFESNITGFRHVGVPEWYFRTTLPPQKCVVVSNKNGDFDAASHAVDQYISDNGITVGANDRRYVICERYNYEGEGFARYSLPIQIIPED